MAESQRFPVPADATPDVGRVVVEMKAVRKAFNVGTPIETEVLHGIDLTLDKGEFCAVMGPSGSGKSTLLNLVGLLDRPTSGTLAVCGEETTTLDDRCADASARPQHRLRVPVSPPDHRLQCPRERDDADARRRRIRQQGDARTCRRADRRCRPDSPGRITWQAI